MGAAARPLSKVAGGEGVVAGEGDGLGAAAEDGGGIEDAGGVCAGKAVEVEVEGIEDYDGCQGVG